MVEITFTLEHYTLLLLFVLLNLGVFFFLTIACISCTVTHSVYVYMAALLQGVPIITSRQAHIWCPPFSNTQYNLKLKAVSALNKFITTIPFPQYFRDRRKKMYGCFKNVQQNLTLNSKTCESFCFHYLLHFKSLWVSAQLSSMLDSFGPCIPM